MPDGSIVFSTELDNKELNRQLQKSKKEIEKLGQTIEEQEAKKSPLVQQAQELERRVKSARLEAQKYAAQWESGVAGADKSQSEAISTAQQLEMQHAKLVSQIDMIDAKLTPAYAKLDGMEKSAGELERELAAASGGARAFAPAISQAEKYMNRFVNRVKGLARRVFVFTLITSALRSLREWLGRAIRTNGEATASIARLKAALLTLAQPLVEIIIPAVKTLADLLTSVVMMTAQIVATMFGMTVEQSKKAAEGLHEEMGALEGTEKAADDASKSLAAFDEINKLSSANGNSGDSNSDKESIEPDFAGLDKNDDWLASMMEKVSAWVPVAMLLGGIALVAIGAATGNLFLVVAGLLLLGYAVTVSEQNQALQSWVDALGLNSVQEFVVIAILLGGIAMVAIGAAMGNILLVLAGLAIIWMAIAYTQSSGMMKSWTEEQVSKAAAFITAALILGGIALIAIGAATANILMVIAGLSLLAAGIYVGIKSGALKAWAEVLGLDSVFDYVVAAIQLAGIALIAIGAAMGNIVMVVAGAAMLLTGVIIESIGEKTLKSWWEVLKLTNIQQWVSAALLLVGVALIAVGAAMANIFMVIAGAAMLGLGIVVTSQNDLQDWVTTLGLEKVAGWVTAALMLAGIAFVVIGAMTVNVLLVVAGIALLGTGIFIGTTTGTFKSWVESLGLEEVAGWVSTAMLLAGIALVAIGAMTLNPLLILAGLGLLGAGSVLKGASYSAKSSQAAQSAQLQRATIPSMATYEIPALATGAVIPANREFLAVLGDQKSGTNIEAPMSTIEEGVENVLRRNGWNGSGAAEIHLIVSAKSGIGKALKFEVDKETERQGVTLVGG